MKDKGFWAAVMKALSKKFAELVEKYEAVEPLVDELLEMAGVEDKTVILISHESEIRVYVGQKVEPESPANYTIDLSKFIEAKK